ncbi:MAG: hypothetical protein MUC96_27900 [Myxococcaceae bacterium]|nr:hypothetical protein [Myxococcaceae bacterium]
MQVHRKLVQGLTAAGLGLVVSQVLLSLTGGSSPGPAGLVARVAVPSFLAGLLFFPLSAKAVATRWALVSRVLAVSSVVCLVNRVLLHAALADVSLSNAQDRWPALVAGIATLDENAQVLSFAVVASGVMAWLAQPLLASVANAQTRAAPALDARATTARAARVKV